MRQAIAISGDHAGFQLKQQLKSFVTDLGYQVLDFGPFSEESVDYPDMVIPVADAIATGKATAAILICGSGIGISIAANRFQFIRAALCHNALTAKLARQHNDANVLALGARIIDVQTAKDCVETFLSTAFEGGRHELRVQKLSHLPPQSGESL
ncbi:MAG: ribose 5-phosphate isomerase B [Alphaproteobacteria bacterium]|nr:ribose 5-phosphate isomerase B [Alphaproteobacteria bacterium]